MHVGNLIKIVASMHSSPTVALAEYPDNAQDAGATNIWVVIEPDRIIVIDNGRGMLPWMWKEDHDTLEAYYQDQSRGQDLAGFDVREHMVHEESKCTFQWFMECIGLSSKKGVKQEGRSTAGEKGVGAQSYLMFAGHGVWFSRPNPEYVLGYWDSPLLSPSMANDAPTLMLTAPSLEDYEKSPQPEYRIEESPYPLMDPYGTLLPHGTRAEFTGIKKGLYQGSLRPTEIERYFKSKFGQKIRDGEFALVIIDRCTAEARRSSQGERVIRVEPSLYEGYPVFPRQTIPFSPLPGVKTQFDAEFYYPEEGKADGPQLSKRGFVVGPLGVIPELSGSPWKDLVGLVEYPDLGDELTPWNSTKTVPLDCPFRRKWVERLRILGDQIEGEIKRHKSRSKDQRSEEISNIASDALTKALKHMGASIWIFGGDPTVTEDPPVRPSKKRGPILDVQVIVLNEHGAGVEDVQIALTGRYKPIFSRTGRHGFVSFGKHATGSYRVTMTVPDGAEAVGTTIRNFVLTVAEPGKRVGFQLRTGVAKGRGGKGKVRGLRIVGSQWATLEPFDDSHIEEGTLRVNVDAPAMRQAIDSSDERRQLELKVACGAMAVAKYLVERHESATPYFDGYELFTQALDEGMSNLTGKPRANAPIKPKRRPSRPKKASNAS